MKKAINGFTLVELLVVIAAIGILSTIAVVGFIRYQAGARDSERSADVQTISHSLESYYLKNGEYPSCSALSGNASTVTSSVLPGMDPSALRSPTASSSNTNSVTCASIDSTHADIFSYQGDQSSACSSGIACRSWTLSYREEATGSIVTVSSEHQDPLAAVGDLTASATTSQIKLTWAATPNATNYDVQTSSSSTFTTGSTTTTNVTGNLINISDLSLGTVYYFRIMPKNATIQGSWSNVVSANLLVSAPTNLSATATSPTNINVSWSPLAGGTATYTMQASDTSDFSANTYSFADGTTTNISYGGMNQGAPYYFRVKATIGTISSDWTSAVSATPPIEKPASPTVAASTSDSTTTFSWSGGSSCPYGTSAQYRYRSYVSIFGAPSWSSVVSTNSIPMTTVSEGYTYVTDVQERCHTTGTNSKWSAVGSASYARPVSMPGPVSYNILRTNNSDNTAAALTVTAASTGCGPGAQIYTHFDAGMWGGLIVWDTGQKGWYADSHSGTWVRSDWSTWGDTASPALYIIQQYPNINYTYGGGSTWAIAVQQKCTNQITGVSSALTGRLESPHMAFPSS